MSMSPLHISSFTATSCIGTGVDATLDALQRQTTHLVPCAFETADIETFIGIVPNVDGEQIRDDLRAYDCRNNRLAQLGLQQDKFIDSVQAAIARWGAARVGVFLGTSTSGILQTELAYRRRDSVTGALPDDFNYRTTQNNFSVSDFVRHYFGLVGPAMVVSTACSSGAKVYASAWRMIQSGVIDAAIVGGVDSLCLTTLYGFNSLGLLSPQPCRPFAVDRSGISIGEAAAFMLLERASETPDADAVMLLGYGESSDAYHMSSPHPDGLGACMAMEMALAKAGLGPDDIDYINLHGTATPSNDVAEGTAVAKLFGKRVPCSSTKGATGHTLGAAGGLEAVISVLAVQHDFMPSGVEDADLDPVIVIDYLASGQRHGVNRVLSNSFGFGGTNCSLILGRSA